MKVRGLFMLSIPLLVIVALVLACAPGPTAKPTSAPPPTSTQKPTTSATTPAAPKTTSSPAGAVSLAGKTITLVVPNAPGGGTDILSRLVTRELDKFLPGNPSMIVRNMPGGGETIGGNYVYAAKGDGLTGLMASATTVGANLLNLGGVKYDMLKMPAILGTPKATVVYASPKIISKPEDLAKAKGVIFGSSAGGAPALMFISLKEMANIPVEKMALAYGGASEVRRAFLAGEINLGYDSADAYSESVAPLVAKGEVIPVYQSGIFNEKGELVKDPTVPGDIMTAKEFMEKMTGKAPSGMGWDAFLALVVTRNYSKIMFLPPGTPDNIVRAYWDGATRMLKDPGFIERASAVVGKGSPWGAGESYQAQFRTKFKIDQSIRDWLRDLAQKYGYALG